MSWHLGATVIVTDKLTGVKVLATVTVVVAMVLAALAVYLCMSCNKHDKGEYML